MNVPPLQNYAQDKKLDSPNCNLFSCRCLVWRFLEDEGGGDADDEEEGGHDEVRHRHPEPRCVVYPRPRPAGVVHQYHHGDSEAAEHVKRGHPLRLLLLGLRIRPRRLLRRKGFEVGLDLVGRGE